MTSNTNFSQENPCTPSGIWCYDDLKADPTNCIIPCRGVYADIIKKDSFKKLLEEYANYKRGFETKNQH